MRARVAGKLGEGLHLRVLLQRRPAGLPHAALLGSSSVDLPGELRGWCYHGRQPLRLHGLPCLYLCLFIFYADLKNYGLHIF